MMQEHMRAALDYAKKRGATSAECHATQGNSQSVRVRNGEIENIDSNYTSYLSIHVIKGDREGYSYTQDFGRVEEMVDMALAHADITQPDDVPPEIYAGPADYVSLNTYNPALESVHQADYNRLALDLEKIATQMDDRVDGVEYCSASGGAGHNFFLNSAGIWAESKRNSIAAYISPIMRAETDAQSGFGFMMGRSLADIDLNAIARKSIDEAAALLGSTSMTTGRYTTLFRADAASELISAFLSIYSAEEAQKGRSLLAGKEGESIAAPGFTLIDDAHNDRIFSCAAFDAQGLPTRRVSLVENGVLQTLMYNLVTAKKAGKTSTAHASGGMGAPVGVSPHALILAAGEKSEAQMLKDMRNGAYITKISGLHAGLNPVSGDFSLLAGGFLVENGEKTRPVNQLTVAGNIFSIMKNIVAFGNETLYNHYAGALATPALLVEGISIAGK